MVNGSLDSLGQTLLRNRMLEFQQKEAADKGAETQQQLKIQNRRVDVDQARQNAAEAHYHRMEQGQMDANTVRLSQQDLQDKQQLFGNIVALNSSGQLKDRDAVNRWLASDPHFAASGIQLTEPTQKAAPQVGQNAVAQGYAQAEAWRQKASQTDDDDEAERYNTYADNLEKWGNLQANPAPKPGPTAYQTDNTLDKNGHVISSRKTPIGGSGMTPNRPKVLGVRQVGP